jgi:hypothetical protein
MSDSEQHLLRWRGQQTGPYTLATIMQMLDDHEIGLWHEIQHEGRWLTVEEFLGQRDEQRRAGEAQERARRAREAQGKMAETQAPRPPPAPLPATPPPAQAAGPGPALEGPRFRPKSMRLFAALGLCLGFTGAHNFYAGYRGTAAAQLLLTVLTLWLGFGFFISWLWAMIELLVVHTDHRGVRMT